MAKKDKTCCCMEHHHSCFGFALLLIGLWFLLTDLGILPNCNINWWTMVFLLVGAKLVYFRFVKK